MRRGLVVIRKLLSFSGGGSQSVCMVLGGNTVGKRSCILTLGPVCFLQIAVNKPGKKQKRRVAVGAPVYRMGQAIKVSKQVGLHGWLIPFS